MRFRPCIDIHNGKVKQIVGGTLLDEGNCASENFVADQDASFFAKFYEQHELTGGHIILLNPQGSEYYEATKAQAVAALHAYPGGMQIGGGIHAENAAYFLEQGASHVIVTSYVFKDGQIDMEHLKKMTAAVGKEHLVLDLSCRKKDSTYKIVTNRWQTYTEVDLNGEIMDELSNYCDEFLIHAVDVEGKASGIEKEVAKMLGGWAKKPVTYAGGVGSYEDLKLLKKLGQDKVDVTIGSALDLFGGSLSFASVLKQCRE